MLDNLIESLSLMLTGILVVFSALAFFSFLIWLLKKSDEKLRQLKFKPKDWETTSENSETEINPELIAIITAAAHETFHKQIRIRRVHFLSSQQEYSSWAASGRLNIMASHNIQLGTQS
ncbi:MAG: hypothetical protein QG635_262 [Bacteroidota bacterium]|nr:hypothetical protein [Bacteroidota bacterium]